MAGTYPSFQLAGVDQLPVPAIQSKLPGSAAAGAAAIAAIALIGGLAAACFTRAFGIVFLGQPRSRHAESAHEVGWSMRIPMAALAAAGAKFLYGKRGAKNRERIAGWALQLKGEVLEKMEKLKDINQDRYNELVEETAERYGRTKRVSAAELKHIVGEMKNAWSHIGKQLKADAR